VYRIMFSIERDVVYVLHAARSTRTPQASYASVTDRHRSHEHENFLKLRPHSGFRAKRALAVRRTSEPGRPLAVSDRYPAAASVSRRTPLASTRRRLASLLLRATCLCTLSLDSSA
jgi:hypothetical protein